MGRTYKRIGLYIAVIVLLIWSLFPIWLMVKDSLQQEMEIKKVPPKLVPTDPALVNYFRIFDSQGVLRQMELVGPIGKPTTGSGSVESFFRVYSQLPLMIRSMVNTFIVGMVVILVNLGVGVLGGYAFSSHPFRGSSVLFVATLSTIMMPPSEVIIPLYTFMRDIGLLDTLYSLMLVHSAMTLPFSIYVTHNYMKTIPRDVEEAARVEGYSRFEVYRKVVLPLIKPALVVVAIFSFMLSYREFFFAFLLTETSSRTLTVIVADMAARNGSPISILAPMAVIALIPPSIITILFSRQLVKGLVTGAVGRG